MILPEERTNHAQQTSLHAACDGNYANIVVDLLAAGLGLKGAVGKGCGGSQEATFIALRHVWRIPKIESRRQSTCVVGRKLLDSVGGGLQDRSQRTRSRR